MSSSGNDDSDWQDEYYAQSEREEEKYQKQIEYPQHMPHIHFLGSKTTLQYQIC